MVAGGEPVGPVGDHKCYVVRTKTGTPRFTKIPGVRIEDEFDVLVGDVGRERQLCNPASIDDAPVEDPTQLACYALRPLSDERPVTPPDLTIRNRFGEQTVRFRPGAGQQTLCVQAEAHLAGDDADDVTLDERGFRTSPATS
ncbi:MAG TPA: hypothetical protein VIS07_08905 [Candidatus Binatia bacterium]